MRRGTLLGLAIVVLCTAALEALRVYWLDSRPLGLACLHHTAPALICGVRSTMGWLVYKYVIGTAALVLGIASLRQASLPIAIAALCTGIAGCINYNVSWGMLGAVLGAWTWIVRPGLCPGPAGVRGPQTPLL